jgi:hypothetical protein
MDQKMNESELRGWLAAHLKRERVPRSVWDILKANGHVEAALRDTDARNSLVEYGRALLLYSDIVEHVESPPEQEGSTRSTPEPPQFSGYEEERAETLVGYLTLRATAYPGVLQFRQDLYGEVRPLTPENAYRLVEKEDIREAVTVYPNPSTDGLKPSGQIEFFSRMPGQIQRIDYYKGSYFERLHNLSHKLIENLFPLWSEAEAAWFVITGEVRVPRALVAYIDSFVGDHLTYGTITLTVQPWVSADTVVKAYKYLQTMMLRRKLQPLARGNMDVVRFVMKELEKLVVAGREGQVDEPVEDKISRERKTSLGEISQDGWAEQERRSWRMLMESWNQANPDSPYQDERQFYRDFHRVAHAVLRPYDADEQASRDLASLTISIPAEVEESK